MSKEAAALSSPLTPTPSATSPLAAPPTANSPLRLSEMLSYGGGQVGAQIMRDTPTVLLPVFMSTMLGISPWLAGLAILVPKLWIILCDPLIGSISDRKVGSWGRTPFLLMGAPLAALCFFLLFSMSPMGTEFHSAVIMGSLYTVMATAYSMYVVPYMALAAELTPDSHQRTTLLAWRIVFTMVGVIAGVGFGQALIQWAGGGSHGWWVMGLSFAVISLVSMLSPALVSGKARTRGPIGAVTVPFTTQMLRAWHNRPFRILLAAFFIQSVGQAASYATVGLIFFYVLGKVELLIPFMLAMSAGTVLSQPVWVALSRRWGKRAVFCVSAVAWSILTVTWFAVTPNSPPAYHLPLLGELSLEQVLALVRAPLIGVLNSGFVLMAQSMLTDVVALDRQMDGTPSEGALSGLFSAAEKLAYALGPSLAGVVLSVAGFHASMGGAVAQNLGALRGILFNYSILPAILVLASLLVIRVYKLPSPPPAKAHEVS